ncbi:hypothetical protein LIER_28184 [Lithospermum erythrorhizon]|uniref:DUF4005 domain-containing protein n=1 Tax=Lithospermum erythrorhizon TaxID=34254 RepID=A0AAV3RGR2_LITER
MAKKKSWFNILKRVFISDSHSRTEKEKRRRWLFGKPKQRRLPSLLAPTERQPKEAENERTISSDEAPQTTGAVFCSNNYKYVDQVKEETENVLENNEDSKKLQSHVLKQTLIVASIKIQTAFRGFLARKALRALKGLVRLQAIIRGRAVRRQAITTLKCLQTIVNIHSEVCAKRCEMVKNNTNSQEDKYGDMSQKDIKIDVNSQRRWDDSLLSKEEEDAHFMSKREAEMKRERIREYWLNHRRSAESEHNKVNARRRYWLEQWVDAQLAKRDDFQNLVVAKSSKPKAQTRDQQPSPGRQLKVRNLTHSEWIDSSPISVSKRSFQRRQLSYGEGDSPTLSPAVPTYMAATESAKAKTRSMSSPRLRPISTDTYSDINSPYKQNKLSFISSLNSEATSARSKIHSNGLSQLSPGIKSVPGTVKSYKNEKDLSLNSDGSMPTWDRCGSFR